MMYFDNHSATLPCQSALERMQYYATKYWEASSSPHRRGQEVFTLIEGLKEPLYDLVGAEKEDLCTITSSGEEAIEQVFWSYFESVAKKNGKIHFIISEIDTAIAKQCARKLEEMGCSAKPAKVKNGKIDLEALEKLLSPKTGLISLPAADPLTGVLQPFQEIAKLCQKHGVLFHLDARHAVGKIPFLFLPCDYFTLSSELIHGPKGIGALFTKKSAPLSLFLTGHFRELSVASLAGFGAAAQQMMVYADVMGVEIARQKELFESCVQGTVLFKEQPRLPNTTAIGFAGVHQEALSYLLQRKEVFTHMGGNPFYPLSFFDETAIGFSFSRMTTEEEVLRSSKIINETVLFLQKVSEGL